MLVRPFDWQLRDCGGQVCASCWSLLHQISWQWRHLRTFSPFVRRRVRTTRQPSWLWHRLGTRRGFRRSIWRQVEGKTAAAFWPLTHTPALPGGSVVSTCLSERRLYYPGRQLLRASRSSPRSNIASEKFEAPEKFADLCVVTAPSDETAAPGAEAEGRALPAVWQ